MKENNNYKISDLLRDIEQYESGWITWRTSKTNLHIDTDVHKYICTNFEQIHGTSCGKTIGNDDVELFRF